MVHPSFKGNVMELRLDWSQDYHFTKSNNPNSSVIPKQMRTSTNKFKGSLDTQTYVKNMFLLKANLKWYLNRRWREFNLLTKTLISKPISPWSNESLTNRVSTFIRVSVYAKHAFIPLKTFFQMSLPISCLPLAPKSCLGLHPLIHGLRYCVHNPNT